MATTSIGAPGVVFPDGTTQASASPGNVVTRIYTSGSTGWTKPAALKAVKVTMVSGGGGGGNSPTNPAAAGQGGGGGGGGVGFGYFQAPVIPAGPLTVTVGAAGGTSTSGGSSSFGSLFTITGGGGGAASPTSTAGTGGVVSPSPTIFGVNGNPGTGVGETGTNYVEPYGGGNTGLGFGYGGLNSNIVAAATGYGGGGSGGNTVTTRTGQAGRPGVVIVEEFY